MKKELKITAILLSVMMVFAMLPILPAQTAYAESNETHPVTTVGVEGLFTPSQANDLHSYVYYGKYNDTPILYRVLDKKSLDFGGFTMLLDCDKGLFDCRFDKHLMGTSDWTACELRSTLNGDSFLNDQNVFTTIERNAIFASTKAQPAQGDGSPSYVYDPTVITGFVDCVWSYAPLQNDKIFVLDLGEATNTSYGYPSYIERDAQYRRMKVNLSGDDIIWWLRSQCVGPNYVGVVADGLINYEGGGISYSKRDPSIKEDGYTVAVSPAFNVDRSKIVLSTRLSGEYQGQGSVHKLSLLDPDLKVTITGQVTRDGSSNVYVPYSITNDSANNVSATRCCIVMTTAEWHDGEGWGDGTTKYCFELNPNEGSFALPADYDESWNTYLIAEQENEGASTNVASAPVKIIGPEDSGDFVIASSDDWDILANRVNNQNYDTSGMVVKLKNNISVTTMIGTASNPFKGTFVGNGKMLTFNANTSEQYCAPFRYAKNATFRDLVIDGYIDTSNKYAAGLVAKATGTTYITNCESNFVIDSHMGSASDIADGTHGGYVAVGDTVIVEGCRFGGCFGGEYTKLCAGFVGWVNDTSGSDCINCYFQLWNIYTHDTANFIRNSSKATNSYYDLPIGQGRDRGKQLRYISGRGGVSVVFAGDSTTYNVSDIIAYSTGMTNRSGGLWAGAGDIVNLTMPDISSQGKQYVASAGELTGSGTNYTLVMPDENVNISTEDLPVETFIVTFVDGQGNTLKTETVEKGQAATAPADPTREGYTFDGWDKDFSNVTSNLTVTAKWKENTTPPTPQEPVSIKNAKVVLSVTELTYNGKVLKPTIKTIKGLTLKAGTDYTVKWSNASSKDVGSYIITITGKGQYTGTTKATYKINPKGTSLKSPKKAKKAATVKWAKQAGKMSKTRITGYQIQLATDSKFTQNKKTVTVKGYKKVSKKVTKLKGKTKYYIRIRTYKTVSGQNYYSPWSKVKTVTTKK